MSVTLVSSPAASIVAARSPMQWQFTSDTSNIRQIICQPVIDSVPQPLQVIYPTASGQFIFDGGRYLQDTLWNKSAENSYGTPQLLSSSIQILPWHSARCYLQVYEVYGDTLPYTDNFALSITDYTTPEITALLMDNDSSPEDFTTGNQSTRFLNNAPPQLMISEGEHEMQGIYNPANSVLAIMRYRQNGKVLEKATIPLEIGIVNIPIGPSNLVPGFLDDCASYSFWVEDQVGQRISEIKSRTLRKQPAAVSQRIHWVNAYGMMDSYTFSGYLSRQSRWQRNTFPNVRTDLLQLASGFESQEACTWLFEMLSSPAVRLQQGNEFIPLMAEDKEKVMEDVRVKLPVFSCTLRYV